MHTLCTNIRRYTSTLLSYICTYVCKLLLIREMYPRVYTEYSEYKGNSLSYQLALLFLFLFYFFLLALQTLCLPQPSSSSSSVCKETRLVSDVVALTRTEPDYV